VASPEGMATVAPAPTGTYPEPKPRYIRQAYLAPGEAVLRETRATLLYYMPGPVILLILFLVLDYSAAAARWGSLPAFPGLTAALGNLKSVSAGGHTLLTYFLYLLGLLTVLVVLWIVVRYFRWMRTAYAVTTSRVIVQRGIFSRDLDEIPVNKVRAIDVHQTLGQRLLGYGTIRVTSEGENRIANEAWEGIPKPWEFQKLADAAAQRYLQR